MSEKRDPSKSPVRASDFDGKTSDELMQMKLQLQADLVSIRDQIGTAQARVRAGTYADPDWWRRVNSTKALKGAQIQALDVRIGALRKQERQRRHEELEQQKREQRERRARPQDYELLTHLATQGRDSAPSSVAESAQQAAVTANLTEFAAEFSRLLASLDAAAIKDAALPASSSSRWWAMSKNSTQGYELPLAERRQLDLPPVANREGLDEEELPEVNFTPDWSAVMTAAEAEAQLEGFRWKGLGWYLERGDALLVAPIAGEPPGDGRRFRFHVWNSGGRSHPASSFSWAARAYESPDALSWRSAERWSFDPRRVAGERQ